VTTGDAVAAKGIYAELSALVLTSALHHPTRAAPAWNDALTIAPIDLWPNELARPLPLVFVNLRGLSYVPHQQLLKGIYRAAWAANLLRLRCAIDVMRDLDSGEVNYRVIKGGAVCALTGDWGARRMGDLDLAIARDSGDYVRDVLTNGNFVQRAPNRSVDGLWESPTGGKLDVHTVNQEDPSRSWVLAEPGRHVEILSHSLHIPSPEVIAALALHHGISGVADSDHIQSQLDIARLLPHCDEDELSRLLSVAGKGDEAANLLQELVDLEIPSIRSRSVHRIRDRQRSIGRKSRLSQVATLVSRGKVVFRDRRIPIRRVVGECPDLRFRLAYLLWISLGQVRFLELLYIRKAGGFIPASDECLPSMSPVVIEPAPILKRSLNFVSIRIPGIEDRFRLRLPANQRCRIRLDVLSRGSVPPRMIFVNGRLQGYLPPDDALGVRLDVLPLKGSVEISLRLYPGAPQPDEPVYVEFQGIVP